MTKDQSSSYDYDTEKYKNFDALTRYIIPLFWF